MKQAESTRLCGLPGDWYTDISEESPVRDEYRKEEQSSSGYIQGFLCFNQDVVLAVLLFS